VPQFPANIDLSNLGGSDGFRLSGAAAGDFSGISVASAGDVNGDGFADLIVGAFSADPNGIGSGASYVVFGGASAFPANVDLADFDQWLNGTNGFKVSGAAAYDYSGRSVASAGDINGDGFGDLIVGAPYADLNGLRSGASYVVFGRASGFAANINLSSLDGSNGFRFIGVAPGDYNGSSVASAGDINGDGFDDLIIGASGADPNGSDSGASYVVFGRAFLSFASFDLSTLNGLDGFEIDGELAGWRNGFSVASAGDVNGDGLFSDVIVGEFGADPNGTDSGATYVMFGKEAFAPKIDLSSLDGSNGFRLNGVSAYDLSGWSVASAGDVNGDGFGDLVIGARNANASYVVFGQASGFAANIDLSSLDGSNGIRLSGAAGDFSGSSVASAGDVNGDGFDDLIVGAFGADPNGTDSGASYVVLGKPAWSADNIDLTSLDGSDGFKISGGTAHDYSGNSVASAGDVNGDGFDDLIVGAFGADPNGSNSGASYVVFGRAPDSATFRTGTAASQTLAGGAFDDILSGLGGNDHLFGNGGNDTLIGGGGEDIQMGGSGTDYLYGQDGDDTLIGGPTAAAGANQLWGGSGNDTASYAGTRGTVIADLAALAGYVDNVLTDQMNSIENLVGGSGTNTLVGNGGVNVLRGNSGNDYLYGQGGDDTLIGGTAAPGSANQLWGGSGNDTASYAGTTGVIHADLRAQSGYLGGVLLDQMNSIENLIGGSNSDTLVGDGGANLLTGGGGADSLWGEGGADTFVYSTYSDSNLVSGYDTIADFVSGTSKLDLSAFKTDGIHVLILSDLQGTSLYVEKTEGSFNASTDLAISFVGSGAIALGDIKF
jgi:hypothetical protein